MTTIGETITSEHRFISLFKFVAEMGNPSGIASTRLQSRNSFAKSYTEAVEYRKKGNEFYKAKCLEKALEHYSRSVAWAPIDSEELALAYGNRSAVLFELQHCSYCLLDVNRALNITLLPEDTRKKLIGRKKRCWDLVRTEHETKSDLRDIILRGAESITGVRGMARNLLFSRSETLMSMDETDLIINYALFDDPIWSTELKNTVLPNVSPKVKLAQNLEWGQHWIAADDIKPGEVLLVQEYYSMKLLEEFSTEYCAHCTIWCRALIPCPTCHEDMYCSVECQRKAYNLYHRTECKLLEFLKLHVTGPREITKIRLALRAFLTGTKQGSELRNLMDDPRVLDMINGRWNCTDQVLPSDDYTSIISSSWKCPEDSSDYSGHSSNLDAFYSIFKALWIKDFFGNRRTAFESIRGSVPLTEVEIFAALLMSQNWFSGQQRSNVIYTRVTGRGSHIGSEIETVGLGMGTLRHFMNHSCIANTMTISAKRRLLVCCTKPIKAGEQIFTSDFYADYLTKPSTVSRQSYLKSIFKVCECRACVEDWPSRDDLLKREDEYLTSDQTVIRYVERKRAKFSEALHNQHKFVEEDLQEAFEFCKTFRKYVKEPSPTMHICDLLIYEYMLVKGNNYCAEPVETYVTKFLESCEFEDDEG